jgi:hypothetical protein
MIVNDLLDYDTYNTGPVNTAVLKPWHRIVIRAKDEAKRRP